MRPAARCRVGVARMVAPLAVALVTVTACDPATVTGSPVLARSSASAHSPDSPGTRATGLRYTPRTVVLDPAVVRRSSRNGADYTLTVDARTARLAAGRVLLVPGSVLRRIVSVHRSGGVLSVRTAPAAVTDALAVGDLRWTTPVDFSTGTTSGTAVGTASGYRYLVRYRPDGRALTMTVQLHRSTPVAVTVLASLTLHSLTTAGVLRVRAGRVSQAVFGTTQSATATTRYTATSVRAFSTGGATTVAMPATFGVPLVIGGVPLQVGLGTSVSLGVGTARLGLSVRSSTTVRLRGSTGIRTGRPPASGAALPTRRTGRLHVDAALPLDATSATAQGPLGAAVGVQTTLTLGVGSVAPTPAARLVVDATGAVHVADRAAHPAALPCDARALDVTGTGAFDAAGLDRSLRTSPVALFAQRTDAAWPRGCGRVG